MCNVPNSPNVASTNPRLCEALVELDGVFTVKVVVAEAPFTFTVGELKEQLIPVGAKQVRATGPTNPPMGLMVSVAVAAWPAGTVTLWRFVVRPKSPPMETATGEEVLLWKVPEYDATTE
jgi:hypothetical protein